jgi:spore cortex formation protein SpoVR/YcgB (stage V sporulation)
VSAILDESGYRAMRTALARAYNVSTSEPDIQVVVVDLAGNRVLKLQHNPRNGAALEMRASEATISLLRELWVMTWRLRPKDRADAIRAGAVS